MNDHSTHKIPPPPPTDEDADDDWEEWDGTSPFWIHCVAGSLAGVVEHTAVYPLDTVRTHIQVCASCEHRKSAASALHSNNHATFQAAAATKRREAQQHSGSRSTSNKARPSSAAWQSGGGGVRAGTMTTASATRTAQPLPTGMWQTMRFLMNEPALSSATLTLPNPTSSTTATTVWQEVAGVTRLWRGVQTMLLGCIPAHALYFSLYETVKAGTKDDRGHVTAWGSSLAGAAATLGHDVVMTPLDTIKQRMQLGHYPTVATALRQVVAKEGTAALYRSFPITLATNVPYGMVMVLTHESCKAWLNNNLQHPLATWQTVLISSSVGGLTAAALTTPLDRIKTALQTQTLAPACLVNPAEPPCGKKVLHGNWYQAARFLYQTEGLRGFGRGLVPRVLSHTPAMAISWTTYEVAKQTLLQHHQQHVLGRG